MHDLNYSIKQVTDRNRDGSQGTRANRSRILSQAADQLREDGFRHLKDVHDLKGRHINALLARWRSDGLSPGTLKNRMAALRWLAEKIGRPSIISGSNRHYAIPDRQYATNEQKAQELELEKLAKVGDAHVRLSLELGRAFGLRREESMKIRPDFADRGGRLVLKASWTKGGKARDIPIRTDAQRAVLDRAHQLAGKGSLIPPSRSYKQQLKIYERHTAAAGLSKMHGLRHAYAQERYKELTGREAPTAGGPTSNALSRQQKAIDREARLTISRELGHEREQITTVYLGR
jgi:site-specific recombinase XerC